MVREYSNTIEIDSFLISVYNMAPQIHLMDDASVSPVDRKPSHAMKKRLVYPLSLFNDRTHPFLAYSIPDDLTQVNVAYYEA